SILGNTSVAGQEGPTFRSEATQTQTTTRFNNGGSATNLSKDSSPADWPLLGPDPGILCKQVDCSGFTRTFDFDPTTAAIDPIPFPGGNNPADRLTQACLARAVPAGLCVGSVATLPALCSATLRVIEANNCTPGVNLTLNGGIWVSVPVSDLRLANIENVGQSIVIYTDNGQKRTIIKENRPANVTTVVRQCLKTAANNTPVGACGGAGASNWNSDSDAGQAPNTQTFAVLPVTVSLPASVSFTPNVSTDYGLIWVNGAIGSAGTLNGLRRGDENGLAPLYAIYQNTGATAANKADGTRLTVVTDSGDLFITGPLNYRIDPRGPDGNFSEPIPGDPTGTSADDQLDVQNVLGMVAWGQGAAGGVHLSSALTGDLATHGMVFVANLIGNAAPSGQFRFDDPNGPYRGVSLVLGGVVQKTMGIFGQPSSNLGYARDWVYDERFRYRALSPPAFPGFPNFTAATSLGIDSYSWRLGIFQ
ncbi:MAG: hypothetical protein ACREMR_01390, partial [Gemmatimonadales bacterium]